MTYTETEVNYKGKATSMTVPTKCKTCPTQILTWMKQSFVIRFLDCGTHKKSVPLFLKGDVCLFVLEARIKIKSEMNRLMSTWRMLIDMALIGTFVSNSSAH